MSNKPTFLSITDFAKTLGVSRQRIQALAKQNKITVQIVDGKKRIDKEQGQREWQENVIDAKKPKIEKVKVADYEGLTIRDAELREKVYRAKMSEAKYLEQAGQLVRADKVQRKAFEVARKTRDAVMSVPARIAHEIAAETDPHKVEVRLSKELAKCLDKLIKGS